MIKVKDRKLMSIKTTIIIGDSRKMKELKDESVHLIITSPPYWQLKDYGNGSQIGFRRKVARLLRSTISVLLKMPNRSLMKLQVILAISLKLQISPG
jgi:DNA modification methylase